MKIKIGNLVKTKRATIGVPKGTVGLNLEIKRSTNMEKYDLYKVLFSRCPVKDRFYRMCDLEVLS